MGDYVRLVEQHAYRVTEDQVTALRTEGMSDDGVFELTVAAALGAAQRRLEDGLALLDSASP